MPGRTIPLVTNQVYHCLNRGIASQPTFQDTRNFKRFIETIIYYQHKKPPICLSHFLKLSIQDRNQILEKLKGKGQFLVEIIAYCLMPNHFHFLLKQLENNGISKFIGQITNSYTKYLNTINKRSGPLFEGKFKAVRIETDEQLLHTHRYIHLNPYSSFLVKTHEGLESYPYSSLPEYLNPQTKGLCSKTIILDFFKTPKEYKEFVGNQADYQRSLEQIKHLTLEP